ncbi:MAG: bifunctional 4-hydroxy-2-oxoglutarate aldolase/2-dehydro-3-deoxy-phosphogluconate aldolase [Planctomycetota bacterium]|jgi:2-dehydro-3-deoxyphosphogluconate aldolase/(4S)-4-hydroxy-2-oxoglutarate aldolase|nr:bifunctional 4-hydroxy-2-oxoglutarate aldolase/2-dehydro-3-deoxy-phosphogluconate aldolase [Planctomycetota bacterium]MDP7131556.1 bifunctional 4-hydroxy-2-oxoglutarate aldolase/2-dehydro-3-deoxy-phosphogluconate aldolase [Planctomycetota bacterium]MDP7250516.1 bifunctional 4-hydroxy-2-oxoglutarate aldolase/2-dehydro-3-deoxy-phosphogluconate aldolase [Planctomycetota bacterium]
MPKKKQEVIGQISELGIVAVVRTETAEQVKGVVNALLEGGVIAIEITFTVPNAVEMIRQTRHEYGDDILLGAGTVTTPSNAVAAIGAGAQYIISPNTNLEIIKLCNELDIAAMPGAMTPTEVVSAWQAGADTIKIFPAEILGPRYIKLLKAPLPNVPLMPTGGVVPDNVGEWLAAGSVAVGVGSALVDKQALATGEFGIITEKAKEFLSAIQAYRDTA